MATVQVKYLGKSKRSFAVRPKGVEYKFNPDKMTHLEMGEDHARVLVAERPDLWGVDPNPLAVTAAEGTAAIIAADIPSTGVTVAEANDAANELREHLSKRRGKHESD